MITLSCDPQEDLGPSQERVALRHFGSEQPDGHCCDTGAAPERVSLKISAVSASPQVCPKSDVCFTKEW